MLIIPLKGLIGVIPVKSRALKGLIGVIPVISRAISPVISG